MELTSGWADDKHVYLVERPADRGSVRVRRMQALWSAFFVGLDESDRFALQRSPAVTGVSVRGQYTRVDFRNRWERHDIVARLSDSFSRVGLDPKTVILEADVNPLRRFLSDHGTANVSTEPRVAWFDLETDSRCSFHDAAELGLARILSWVVTTLENGEAREVARGVLAANTDAAERDLIEDLIEVFRDYDVLLAWSGSGFDFPVLEKRAQAVHATVAGSAPVWQRWCFLDALEVFKKYHAHVHESGQEKTSYKLNSIAQAVVGEGKTDFEASRTWEAWFAGGPARQRLVDYNAQDALLMPKIEAKTGYVALHLAVCAVTRCFPDDRSLMASQQGDGFLLRLGEVHGHRWPTKTYDNEVAKYSGAFVMEPTRTGIIDNVHVADFASLYPSIIRSWNISPETVMNELEGDPTGGCCMLPYTGDVRFVRGVRGMFPLALDELVERRAAYSKRQDEAEPGSPEWERYKRLSGAYKIVANSFYGIMGSPFTRFYCSKAAEAVTQTGAWLIKHVGSVSSKYGLEAFYGDTDSLFVTGDPERFSRVVAKLNQQWQPMLHRLSAQQCHLKLEFEKSFSRIVLVSAKRYIGRFSRYKGKAVSGTKIEVKGLEYKRGDTVALARDMQKELIDLLLDPEKPPTVEDCVQFVDRWRERVMNGELTVEDVVLSQSVKGLSEYAVRYTSARCMGGKGKDRCTHIFGSTDAGYGSRTHCPRCGFERKISKPPVHVRVAKVLAERGEEIRAGTRVEYVIVSNLGEATEALPARDPGVLDLVSRDYYWEHRIYPPTERVLQCAFPEHAWAIERPKKPRAKKKIDGAEQNFGELAMS